MTEDRNDLAFWFPKILAAGLPVPETTIFDYTPDDLMNLLDGETPREWDALVAAINRAGDGLGWPCFLRTGHGSGKHDWRETCWLERPEDTPSHVARLVEWSANADMWGLPTRTWAVRRVIPTRALFTCDGFGGFPVTREFRYFIRDGTIEHVQPYWPPDALKDARPDVGGRRWSWSALLEDASRLGAPDRAALDSLARLACQAVGGGYWSVDFLQDHRETPRAWWLTDMAEGDRSFRWEP